MLVVAAVVFAVKMLLNKNKGSRISKYSKIKNDILREYDRFIVEADKVKNSNENKIKEN